MATSAEQHRHKGRGILGVDGRWRLFCDGCNSWLDFENGLGVVRGD